MNELQARKEELQGLIDSRKKQLDEGVSLAAKGVIESEIAAFESEIAAMETQAEQEAAQQVRIQAQEEKVDSEPIPIAVSGVDLSNLDPELIQLMEIVTKADRRARNVDFNAEVEAIQTEHKEQLRQASVREQKLQEEIHKRSEDSLLDATKIDELEKEVKDIRNMYEESQKQVHTLEFHVSQAESKRDAAANELAGLQEAYKASQEEIQQMRVANVFGEKKSQQVIDITPDETNKAQNLVDSLVKKFVSTTPIGGNWHEVVDDAGNKMVVHTNDLPKPDQVLPFPGYQVDQTNVESSTNPAQVTIPAISEVTGPEAQFHQDTVQSGDEVDHGASSTDGQSQSAVTREEHEALKARVDSIEKQINVQAVA